MTVKILLVLAILLNISFKLMTKVCDKCWALYIYFFVKRLEFFYVETKLQKRDKQLKPLATITDSISKK